MYRFLMYYYIMFNGEDMRKKINSHIVCNVRDMVMSSDKFQSKFID